MKPVLFANSMLSQSEVPDCASSEKHPLHDVAVAAEK